MYFGGTKIYNPSGPWKYRDGGKIHAYPDMNKKQLNNDSVHIVAMPGELIVPVTHPRFPEKGQLVQKVVSYLKTNGVRLPNT